MNIDAVASLVSLSVDVSTNFYDRLPNYLSQDTYLKTELTSTKKISITVVNRMFKTVRFIKNWSMLSVRTSRYGCTREVWRARDTSY